MQARLVRTRPVIEPFGLDVDACAVGDTTFAGWRQRTLQACNLKAADGALDEPIAGPALVLRDDVWLSRRALRGFLSVARAERAPTRMCLPRSRLLELFLPLQDVDMDGEGRAAFEVGFVPSGVTTSPSSVFGLGPAQWRAPPYRELPLALPAPRHILGRTTDTLVMPLTSTVAMRVRHWVHVLRAGHLAPQVMLLDRAVSEPMRSALRMLSSVRLSHAARMHALRAQFVYRGRSTFIHPTATVESSVLGDGVTVGAYSYVVNSVVGAGSVIEQRAHVSGCALGPRTFVSLNSSIQACVTFGDTDACINGVQACVIGPRCALTSFARPLDLAPEGEVRVDDAGTLRSVGELPCGVAFGPDVFVGAGVTIAAGRAVPRGVRLYADGREILHRSTDSLAPGSYSVVDGAARAAPRNGPGSG